MEECPLLGSQAESQMIYGMYRGDKTSLIMLSDDEQ